MSDFYEEVSLFPVRPLNSIYLDNFDWETRSLVAHRRAVLLFETLVNGLIRLFGKNVSIPISSKKDLYACCLDCATIIGDEIILYAVDQNAA